MITLVIVVSSRATARLDAMLRRRYRRA